MPIHIYNSLTRQKEELKPLNPPRLNIYTCGVTVYDDSHIGHARSLFIFDLMRRYLKFRGYKVRFVRNITDIDDKIIKRANELKVGWKELVEKYIARYHEDLKSLGIKKGDVEPRATENIPDMVKYIQSLIDKGFAYEAGGDVYFCVRKFDGYGRLSNQGIDQMQKGVRVESSESKNDPLDFALWKKSKPDEPWWDSPWGRGRPGWHIECSVMSQKFLKAQTLDIHAGGLDLIFPHHENENAQSESHTGKPFAKYWIHHGLLTINGSKMAKSAGNFITIKDFVAKYKYVDFLKMLFLSAHYSHPVDFTEEKITEAKQALSRIGILLGKIDKSVSRISYLVSRKEIPEIEEIRNKFIAAMDDDFNTPEALACVFELVNATNKNIANKEFCCCAKRVLLEFMRILGLSLEFEVKAEAAGIGVEEINTKITERNNARKSRNFSRADEIRKELEAQGVILEDAKDGTTTWRRKL